MSPLCCVKLITTVRKMLTTCCLNLLDLRSISSLKTRRKVSLAQFKPNILEALSYLKENQGAMKLIELMGGPEVVAKSFQRAKSEGYKQG